MAGSRQVSEFLRLTIEGMSPAVRGRQRLVLNKLAEQISPPYGNGGPLPLLLAALSHEIAFADAIEASDFTELERQISLD